MKIIFATRLKSKRLERGFSQRELAKGICEQGQISRMEQGKYMPGSDLLYSLAQKLNVKMDYFFDEKIPVENSQIEKIRELVKTILIRRDYDTLKYIYEIEISKKSTLSLSDQIYIAWVESMVEFYSNNNRDRGRGILKELISRIGISNFNSRQTLDLIHQSSVRPMVDQIETHLLLQQWKMHEFLEKESIVHESYSPLGNGQQHLMSNPVLTEIGEKYGKSPIQIILRYLVQNDVVTIPRSTNPAHIKSNIDIFDFELDSDDLKRLRVLDERKPIDGWPAEMREDEDY